jgi:hypothetical protein
LSHTRPNHGRSSPFVGGGEKGLRPHPLLRQGVRGRIEIDLDQGLARQIKEGERRKPFILAGVFRLEIARRAGGHALDPRLGVRDPNLEILLRQSGELLPLRRLGLGDAHAFKGWRTFYRSSIATGKLMLLIGLAAFRLVALAIELAPTPLRSQPNFRGVLEQLRILGLASVFLHCRGLVANFLHLIHPPRLGEGRTRGLVSGKGVGHS